MRSLPWLVIAASYLVAVPASPAAPRPNTLLIPDDNWRWPNAGVLGDPLARTPTFDRVVRQDRLFTHVFNSVHECSPIRAVPAHGTAGPRTRRDGEPPKRLPVRHPRGHRESP